MQISKEWCGFTGGQADTLRKAVGKKKIKLMEEVKPQFIEGAIKVGGATREIAEKFWDQLLDFANYCFNKSHAACYALVAYWTAYLKAHYPDAFMAALMTSDMRWTEKLAPEISECKRMGIKVLGPDINQSYGDFGIVGGEKTIRFGLSGVKNIGKALIEEIVIPERDKNGPFKSVLDFAKRIDSTKFNKKAWESAIKTGAFDSFGYSRSDLLYNLETIQSYGAKVQKDTATGQMDLFSLMGDAGKVAEPEIKPAPAQTSEKEQLLWERDLMGLYLSAHPLDKYDLYFDEQTHPMGMVCPENQDKVAVIGGIITNVRTITTSKGDKMAFLRIENKTREIEVIVFPRVYATCGAKLEVDNVVRVQGQIDAKNKDGSLGSDAKIKADVVEIVPDDVLENYKATGTKLASPWLKPEMEGKEFWRKKSSTSIDAPKVLKNIPKDPRKQKLFLLVKSMDDVEILTKIRELADEFSGMQEVVLVVIENGQKKALKMPFRVDICTELLDELEGLLGKASVKVV